MVSTTGLLCQSPLYDPFLFCGGCRGRASGILSPCVETLGALTSESGSPARTGGGVIVTVYVGLRNDRDCGVVEGVSTGKRGVRQR